MKTKMETSELKECLHDYIERADEELLLAMYKLLGMVSDTDKQRKELIRAERENYLKGKGISHTPEQVRAMALNRKKSHAV